MLGSFLMHASPFHRLVENMFARAVPPFSMIFILELLISAKLGSSLLSIFARISK